MIEQVAHRSRRAMVALVLYGAALFWINHIPLSGVKVGVGGDKAAHFWAYAILALLMAWTAFSQRRGPLAGYLLLLLAAAVYGALDELLQHFVPRRHADVADWLADLLGSLAGLGFHALTAATLTRFREAVRETAAESR